MNRIIFPLKLKMSGETTADLQSAFQILLKHKLMLANHPSSRSELASALKTEQAQQFFDGITAKLVAIFQEENQLTSSGKVDEVTAKVLNDMLAGLGVLDAEPTDDAKFVVHGTVSYTDGLSATGLIVRAFDRDMRTEELLGEIKTDAKGHYEIRYSAEKFQKAEKNRADLRVKAFGNDGKMVATSTTFFNAEEDQTINLALEQDGGNGRSEYERYLIELTPLMGKITLAELTEEDVEFLTGETKISAEHIRFLQLDSLWQQSNDVEPAVFYGLFRQGLPTILRRILAQKPSRLSAALKKSIANTIIPRSLGKLIDDIELRLSELALEAAFNTESDDATPPIGVVIANTQGLSSAQQKSFVSLLLDYESKTNTNFWTLASAKLGDDKAVKALQRTLQASVLILHNLPMLKQVQQEIQGESVQAMAGWEEDDWQAVIQRASAHGKPVPLKFNNANEYARAIVAKVDALMPSQSLLARASKTAATMVLKPQSPLFKIYAHLDLKSILDAPGLNPDDRKKEIQTKLNQFNSVFQNNPGLDLRYADLIRGQMPLKGKAVDLQWGNILPEDQAKILKQARAFQRVMPLAKDTGTRLELLSAGFDSSHKILATSTQRLATATQMSTELAIQVRHKASAQVTANETIRHGMASVLFPLPMNVDNVSPDVAESFRELVDVEQLFGAQNFCDCTHCNSVLSQSAYFVDLMAFVDTHISQDTDIFGATGDTRRDSALYLPKRRPDLWSLELNCKNIHTQVPYLEVVNHTFEKFLISHLTDVVDRNGLYQRLSDPTGYSTFNQPLWLAQKELNLYLSHFNLTRADVFKVIGRLGEHKKLAYLDVTQAEFTIMTQVNNNIESIRDLYRVEGGSSDVRIPMRRFMQTTGLSREEVTQLLNTSTLYPPILTVSAKAVEGGLGQLFEQEELQSTNQLQAVNRLDVIHRWVRLWRKTDWSLIDFDFVLSRLKSAGLASLDVDEAAVYQVANLRLLQSSLQLDVEQLISLFYRIPEPSAPRFDERPDLSAAFLASHGVLLHRLFGEAPLDGDIRVSEFSTESPTVVFSNPSDLYRLLAGLSVSESELFTFVIALRHDLAAPPSGDVRTIELTLENLSTLYRHALLARKLNQSPTEFFVIIQLLFGAGRTSLVSIEDMLLITETLPELDNLPFSLSELNWLLLNQKHKAHGIQSTSSEFIKLKEALLDDIDIPDLYFLLSNIYNWNREASREENVAGLSSEMEVALALAGVTLEALQEAAVHSDDSLLALVARLDKWQLIQANFELNVSHQRFIADNPVLFGDAAAPDLALLKRLAIYHAFVSEEKVQLDIVHDVLLAFGVAERVQIVQIAALLEATPLLVASLIQAGVMNFDSNSLAALSQLQEAITLCQTLGVNGDALAQIAGTEYPELQLGRDAILGAFIAKYPEEEQRQELLEPYSESVLELRRDGLVDYLLSPSFAESSPMIEFSEQTDLYRFFLMDSEMDGCARTSWVLAGISSVQLYVQRCLMNLEQNSSGTVKVPPSAIPRDEWVWRKNYRVWEANRRVFLYPENYLYPDLRDDKTPFFEEGVDELQQQEISQETAESAYKNYFDKFMKVANMKYAGAAYTDAYSGGPLYLFAYTHEDPPQYHYRTFTPTPLSDTGVWSHWHKIDLPINATTVSPFIYQGKLYVFWVDIKTRMLTEITDGNTNLTGYAHTIDLIYSHQNSKGKWEPQTKLRLRDAYEDVFIYRSSGVFINPVSTRGIYHSVIREAAKDEHTLSGIEWDRIYPYLDRGRMVFRYGSTVDNHRRQLSSERLNKISLLSHSVKHTEEFVLGLGNESFEKAVWAKSEASAQTFPIRRVHEVLSGESYKIQAIGNTFRQNFIASIEANSYLLSWSVDSYAILRLGTTVSESLGSTLHKSGIDSLLSLKTQFANGELDPVWSESDVVALVSEVPEAEGNHINFKGACGNYYRELYFHLPFQIAENLNANQKFEEAQRWYHYIFDPTAADDPELDNQPGDRNWRYAPFRFQDTQKLQDMLSDEGALEQYRKDPFNPWAIARLRPGAMQKAVVMKYIDNLLDWGDHLFTQDSYESINEATLLYITALDILGERPAKLGACSVPDTTTYAELTADIEGESEFVVLENLVQALRPNLNISTSAGSFAEDGTFSVVPSRFENLAERLASGNQSSTIPTLDLPYLPIFIPEEPLDETIDTSTSDSTTGPFLADLSKVRATFCIPANEHLLTYWDRVEDRLFKIRHCMNISGMRRALALYAPRIDPMLLVRAKAAGLSIEDVLLNTGAGQAPIYRFPVQLERARNLVATVQSFGGALLSSLEKKDAEELNLMRTMHEQNIISLTRKVKQGQILEAQRQRMSLEASQTNTEKRHDHYTRLIEDGLIPLENTQQILRGVATGSKTASSLFFGTASIAALVPQLGSPFAMKYGGAEIHSSTQSWANTLDQVASISNDIAGSLGLAASFRRRKEDWVFQRDTANQELNQIDQQIEAAKLREEIALRDLEIYDKTVEQSQEQYDFVKGKFTQVGLYNWMAQHLTKLHRQAYTLAYEAAKQAEHSYNFERGDSEIGIFIEPTHWEQDKAGLLAGEQLMIQLLQMDQSFHTTNLRRLELTKSISLSRLNPEALFAFIDEGKCDFSIPAWLFDMDFPGHGNRRIKNVRLTIPAVTGPYTTLAAELTHNGSGETIATSSGQNDSGVFELNFRDERFLPFEGRDVDSSWTLCLPGEEQFDRHSISDVILHISYTAIKLAEPIQPDDERTAALYSVISVRSQFPVEWALLQESEATVLEINLNHLPYGANAISEIVQHTTVLPDSDPGNETVITTEVIDPNSWRITLSVENASALRDIHLFIGSNRNVS